MRKQAVTAIKLQREFEGKLSPTGKADLDSELAGDDEATSYDVGTASAALEKCSKAQLQAAVACFDFEGALTMLRPALAGHEKQLSG